jgi:chemosensory pili system protein ChpA (sensor histidine kinase/response regulator)
LRDLELQAETQMASRMEAARHAQQAFDPLEMDRFTRVQELTRMMAESVSDVGTVQRGLQVALQGAEDQLAAQARLTRELQDDLLRARMVEFDTVSDRLYRVVRQSAKETGKQVRLNLSGGAIELDRSVLDRMAPAFEHLLRNAVVHGIEAPGLREVIGKDAAGTIDVNLRQVGNEVRVEVRDDGAGLDLPRIAERARAAGLLADDARPTEADLAGLIFRPGFSTATEVTELAGRGIGMDVVRSEVTAMGGRIETSSAAGRGTAFQLVLPLTTAVTQVVVLDCGGMTVAVPSTLVELVRRVSVADAQAAYASGVLRHGERDLPFFWLGALLQHGDRGPLEGRTVRVLIIRSASQRVAVHVAEVLGNQEVVVKNLGPQLARMPGLAGMSLMVSGQTVLIYNPVALAAVYGEEVHRRLAALPAPQLAQDSGAVAVPLVLQQQAPLVMVVDDSLTVRRVTQRLLQREGYRVSLARDGLEALELLAGELPDVVLSDIEMPRMDGFDLVRNLRAEARWRSLPVIMITSRIAQKHRDHALELGVDHYLGKPYDEDMLLSLVRGCLKAKSLSAH